jgi:hypothetical protein
MIINTFVYTYLIFNIKIKEQIKMYIDFDGMKQDGFLVKITSNMNNNIITKKQINFNEILNFVNLEKIINDNLNKKNDTLCIIF